METTRHIFRVDRGDINYLRVIIESYDGMAIVRTLDPYAAFIELEISPCCKDIVFDLLKSLRVEEDINLEEISRNFNQCQDTVI